jgi:hypothetical protein
MPENDNKDGAVKPEDVEKFASKETDHKTPAKPDTKTLAVKKTQTVSSAYELLTGNQLDANNPNVFAQMDRAFRQSNDTVLKEKIAKDLGFEYKSRRNR